MYICYCLIMEVTITQFRRELFTLVNQAMDGAELWVTHKGRRFKITPEKPKGSKLSRLTRRDFINYDVPEDALRKEMFEAMQKDWDEI